MQYYKFTSISARSIASIISGRFFAATLEKMNDPFEDRFKDAEGSLLKLVKTVGVLSVSRSYKDDILRNPLMWAHYGSNHSGIAIGLDSDKEKPEFSEVKYLSKEHLEDRIKLLLQEYSTRANQDAQVLVDLAFGYKHDYWSYEQEFRRVVLNGNRYVDPLANINEIVFGFRSKPEDELSIWCALRDSVRYRKATNSDGHISIEEYTPPKNIQVTGESLLLPHNSREIVGVEVDEMYVHPKSEFTKDA